jgi:ribose transport system substrate-binding protein
MKKLLVLMLGLVMVFALTACGGESEPAEEEGSADAGMTIGLSVSTLNNPFFVTLKEGAEAKAEELGAELIVVDAGDDAAKQTSDIEDLVSKNIAVLVVNPVDSDAVAPAVEAAMEKGIKVVAVDRMVNGVDVECSIASDNVSGAEMATEFLVEQAGEGAKCGELQGVNGASATVDRGKGFHNVADKKLDVVASQTANSNRDEGLTVMENILQANPDIKCVFAHNDEMALGALEALSGKDIIVAGFDATDDALAAIKDGKMAATVAQKPDLMGGTAVENAVKLINGEEVEKSIPVEVKLVTKDNVDE